MLYGTIYIRTHKSLTLLVRLILSWLLLLITIQGMAQQKSKKTIQIENANIMLSDVKIVKDARRLIGDVRLTHKNIVMKCDSAWVYSNTNQVDAFGNVHILSNDTLNLWARYIRYDGNTELAKARYNVVLEDPTLTLTTDSLDFDMKEEIGYYNYGGTIVDSTNTLTSEIGRYYTQINELFFTRDVVLKNENYTMTADTMIYNTETEIVNFEGPTRIVGDSTFVYSTLGWFNTRTNESQLERNSTIRRGDTQIQADYIFYNDNNGEGDALGSVVINDFANNMIVAGNKAEYDDFEQYAMVTDSAIWIQYYEEDSLFLHADTLYTMPDTSAVDAKILLCYHDVRFFRSDMQGVADSLAYYTNDSTIQLYNDPVLWSGENQMTADYIEFINNTPPPNEVYMKNNSFIIQQLDSSKFNQIKGKNMLGLIKGQSLFRIDVNGNGQSIYYPADKKDYIGLNKAESSNIILYLNDNQIRRITFVGSPVGVMNPLMEVVSSETRLDGFDWRAAERPLSRYDIFGVRSDSAAVKELPDSEIKTVLPDIQQTKKELDEQWNERDLK